mgnify:CR=1 FL=1
MPLAGYVLVEPYEEKDQKTKSGLVLPQEAKDKPMKGIVIAVGAPIIHYEAGGVMHEGNVRLANESSPVKLGDEVVFHKWSGQDIQEGQKNYKLVKFSDLMGVYENVSKADIN